MIRQVQAVLHSRISFPVLSVAKIKQRNAARVKGPTGNDGMSHNSGNPKPFF